MNEDPEGESIKSRGTAGENADDAKTEDAMSPNKITASVTSDNTEMEGNKENVEEHGDNQPEMEATSPSKRIASVTPDNTETEGNNENVEEHGDNQPEMEVMSLNKITASVTSDNTETEGNNENVEEHGDNQPEMEATSPSKRTASVTPDNTETEGNNENVEEHGDNQPEMEVMSLNKITASVTSDNTETEGNNENVEEHGDNQPEMEATSPSKRTASVTPDNTETEGNNENVVEYGDNQPEMEVMSPNKITASVTSDNTETEGNNENVEEHGDNQPEMEATSPSKRTASVPPDNTETEGNNENIVEYGDNQPEMEVMSPNKITASVTSDNTETEGNNENVEEHGDNQPEMEATSPSKRTASVTPDNTEMEGNNENVVEYGDNQPEMEVMSPNKITASVTSDNTETEGNNENVEEHGDNQPEMEATSPSKRTASVTPDNTEMEGNNENVVEYGDNQPEMEVMSPNKITASVTSDNTETEGNNENVEEHGDNQPEMEATSPSKRTASVTPDNTEMEGNNENVVEYGDNQPEMEVMSLNKITASVTSDNTEMEGNNENVEEHGDNQPEMEGSLPKEPTVRASDAFGAEGEVNPPELQKHEQSYISLTDSELGSGSCKARPGEHPQRQSSFPEADTSAESDPPSSSAPPETGAKQSRVEDFLTELGLKTPESEKLSLSNVLNLSAKVLQNKVPRLPRDIPNYFLWNLMIVNSKSRNFKYSLAEEGQVGKRETGDLEFLQPEEIPANSYHPLDIMMAIFLRADTFLQQELMLKMSLCQFALPLLLPDGKEGCTFLLWALRSVVKKWRPLSLQASAGFKEANMVTERVPTFSFLRLGTCSISKSKILNDALSTVEQHHDFFVHSGMECGNVPRKISDGLAELCWYLPSGSADLDLFPEPMAIFNLRGDGRTFRGQAQFLAKASSALFVFVDNVDGGVSSYLSSLVESAQNLFVILSRKDLTDETRSQVRELISSSVVRKECVLVLGKKNDAEFARLLRTVLKEIVPNGNHQVEELPTPPSQTTGKRLEDMAAIARRVGVKVDEDEQQCSLGRNKSEGILRSIKTEGIESFKKARMTFQGDTWQKISQLEKEECRLKKRGQMSVNQYINQLRKSHKVLCNAQRREGLSADVKVFIEALTGWEGGKRKHFLQWMKFGLDSSSRETLSVLRERYKALYESSQEDTTEERETLAEVWRQLQRLDRQITASSLGLEHFMREIGLIYERFTEKDDVGKEEMSVVYRLPSAAADLMLDGFPLELIDGDVSNIPLRWVTAVLKAVEAKIGRETRVFVLTVLGVQSTGKSTLLNTMFGLQFAVSSGRCTRGAFMQLIPVTGQLGAELGCGYVMVIDTEGLKAPELSGVDESHEHDNELATLAIGLSDVTLVNLAMENSAEMKDVLQIAVHAFIRMKEVGKRPACYFVHQNVSDVSAHDQNIRGRKRLLEQLDTMTWAAAKMEKQERRFTKFADVLEYDAKLNNWYIPGLWHGNPPMAAVNTGYSQKVFELRRTLFKCFSSQPPKKHKLSTVSEFVTWTQALWKAVKYENFIFSFRNSLVAEAYKELSIKYTDLEWQLRKDIHTFVEMAENKIANAKDDPERVAGLLKRDQEQLLEKSKQRALQELEDYFCNSNNAHLIEKYRADFVSSIDSVITECTMYADIKSNEAVQRWRNLQKMNEIKASYQSQIEGQVNKLLQKCRQEKRSMDDDELRKEFEVMWEKTLSTLQRGPNVVSDVVSDMETKLIQNMPAHSHLINETLAGKDWFQTEFGAFRIGKDHIDRKTVDDSPQAFAFVRLLRGIFPKKCNISQRAEEWAMWWLEECSEFVGDMVQRRQDYDSTYFQELLRTVDEKIRKHNDKEFSFTVRFKVDFSIHVCGVASGKFEAMQDKFRKRSDALELLNKEKMNYYNSFRNIYQEKDQTKQRAELFCKSCLEPALMNAVIKKLGPEIVDRMRYYGKGGKFKFRKNFQVALMLHLKEEDNFDNYHRFIQRTVSYEKTWLRRQVTELCAATSGEQPLLCSLALDILKTFIKLIKAAIKNVTSQAKEVAVSRVIQMLKEKLGSEIQIPDIQLAAITFGDAKINVEHFTQEVTSFICEVEDCLVRQINGWANDVDATIKTLPVDPTKELYVMLSGCGTRCPFCGVLCDCTNAKHSQHSVEYHRPQGLTGYHSSKSRKLVTENCTTLVASDTKFRNQDTKGEFWPYKDYRNLGTKYSCWNIIADTTIKTSAFWKWVFHTYNQQFAQKYTVLPADPISGWNLSWGEIREDIENSYNVRIDEFY